MVITAGEDNKWYSVFSGEDVGSFTGDNIVASEGGNDLIIDRVLWTDNIFSDFRLNRNPNNVVYSSNADFNTFFAANTSYYVHVLTDGGNVTIPITSVNWRSIGGHWLNLRADVADEAILNTVATGQTVRVVIDTSITPPSVATERDASFSARAGDPTASIAAQSESATERDASFSARAGDPTASISAQADSIVERDASFSARAGDPTASIAAQSESATERDASFSSRAGDPTASISAQADSIVERDASFSSRAGDPTASIAAQSESVPYDKLVDMVITAEEDNKWYSVFNGEDVGSFIGDNIVASEGGNDLIIDRAWWTANANNDLRFNRNPSGTVYSSNADFNVFFLANTFYHIHVITDGGNVSIPLNAANWRSIGPHYLNLTVDAATETILNTVSATQTVRVVIDTRSTPPESATERDASFSARAGDPTASISAQADSIVERDASFSSRAGDPTASISAQADSIVERDASFSSRAGDPTASISAQADSIVERDASFSSRAGDPTASISAQADSIVERDASFSSRAGDPTASVVANPETEAIVRPIIERKSLLPYTWDAPFTVAFDRAARKTREDLGLYRNLMREMVDIDKIPAQLLDNVAFRWGALAWPLEDFISDADELVMYKREVLRRTWELNKYAGQIVDGRWLCGDIISNDLRGVEYSYQIGNVAVAVDGTVTESSFTSTPTNNQLRNAIQITLSSSTIRMVSAAEQSYLRRVYSAYLPILMYVMPIQLDTSARLDITAYAGVEFVQDVEVIFA